MGTRSLVAVQQGNTYHSVYCHYDGYLDYAGRILQAHWDSTAAAALIARGDNSGIKETMEEMNFYEAPAAAAEHVTEFERSTPWQVAHSFEQLLEQVHGCGGEYYYVMRDGVWFAGCVYDTEGLVKNSLVALEQALETIAPAIPTRMPLLL